MSKIETIVLALAFGLSIYMGFARFELYWVPLLAGGAVFSYFLLGLPMRVWQSIQSRSFDLFSGVHLRFFTLVIALAYGFGMGRVVAGI